MVFVILVSHWLFLHLLMQIGQVIHLIGSQPLGLLSFLAKIPLSGLQSSKPQCPNPSLMQSIQIKFGFNSNQLADIFTKALPSSFP